MSLYNYVQLDAPSPPSAAHALLPIVSYVGYFVDRCGCTYAKVVGLLVQSMHGWGSRVMLASALLCKCRYLLCTVMYVGPLVTSSG